MYRCVSCGEEKSMSSFKTSNTAKRGHRGVCKGCDAISLKKWVAANYKQKEETDRKWKEANQDKVLNSYFKYNLKRNFGITVEDYYSLLDAQGGVCAICGTDKCSTGRRFAVDHNHSTGVIRGLLCQACNTGIGKLGEDIQLLHRAITYLEQQDIKVKRDA